jgi:hypothetical protein
MREISMSPKNAWTVDDVNLFASELLVTMVKVNPEPPSQPPEGTIWFDYFLVTDPGIQSSSTTTNSIQSSSTTTDPIQSSSTTTDPIQSSSTITDPIQSSLTTTSESSSTTTSTNIGAIVGGVIGGIFFIVVIVALTLVALRRRNKRRLGQPWTDKEVQSDNSFRTSFLKLFFLTI